MSEPFTFGIPLIARESAGDWALVEALLGLTLDSLAAQGDRSFRVVVAGHDRPEVAGRQPFAFLPATWPAEPVRADNLDRGRKVQAINEAVLATGGGLLMILDADDWVDTRLVATARAAMAPGVLGGVVERGYAVDLRRRRALAIPTPGVFDAGFDRLCGSSVVARLDPAGRDALHRDPYAVLHEHYRFSALCEARGARWCPLALAGAYVINTRGNHSETHGPHAAWRRRFSEAVAERGAPVDEAFLARFGLDGARLAARMPEAVAD